MMENQYPETVRILSPEITRTLEQLRRGMPPSEIATALHEKGLSDITLVIIFREATGASIRDLKAFGQWWGRQGVTDPTAFNDWASQIFQLPPSSR